MITRRRGPRQRTRPPCERRGPARVSARAVILSAVVSDIPEALRAALGERYHLVRVLGRGGMATVYLADDRKHNRQVAVKVLRQDLAASIGAERFLKEIEIAARLTHPHILALHDSGQADGVLYYVMPFIDGGSLRTRLEAAGRIDTGAALNITSQVAGALSYAHRMGVLHRDIKPENILFAQGLPVVADFGIARAISTAGGENLTRTGFPLGTPGYMSPEQAAGLTDLDVRTDVYSLAVVCYEMLTGSTPGRWPTEDAVRTGRFLDAAGAQRVALDALPPTVEPALVRAMAIRSEQRTDSPEALIGELTGARPVPAAAPRQAPSAALARRYSDDEIQEIMRRAAELDATMPTLGGALTIGGVQQAAAEAGIAPELVRRAAAELGAPRRPASLTPPDTKGFVARLIGGPTRLLVERVVPGEVPDAEFPTLIEEVRSGMGSTGIVSTLGHSVSWVSARGTGSGGLRDVQIDIIVRAGQTRIVMREGMGGMIGGIFGGVGGGMGGGGLGPLIGYVTEGLRNPAILVAAIPLWLGLTYATARTSYHYTVKRRHKQLNELADRLVAVARDVIAEHALPRRTPPERLRA